MPILSALFNSPPPKSYLQATTSPSKPLPPVPWKLPNGSRLRLASGALPLNTSCVIAATPCGAVPVAPPATGNPPARCRSLVYRPPYTTALLPPAAPSTPFPSQWTGWRFPRKSCRPPLCLCPLCFRCRRAGLCCRASERARLHMPMVAVPLARSAIAPSLSPAASLSVLPQPHTCWPSRPPSRFSPMASATLRRAPCCIRSPSHRAPHMLVLSAKKIKNRASTFVSEDRIAKVRKTRFITKKKKHIPKYIGLHIPFGTDQAPRNTRPVQAQHI